MFRFLRRNKDRKLEKIFHQIYYKSDLWKLKETGSGSGSTLQNTKRIREQIPAILKMIHARSLLDAPCGDFNWMSQTDLDDIEYTGADIIPKLIKQNQKKYPGKHFVVADITKDPLPIADVVLCRDCFIHLSNQLVLDSIANFRKSGIAYLLTNTYSFITENRDIEPGGFRMINLYLPPFSFPEADLMIEEGFTDGFPDKKLGLWKL